MSTVISICELAISTLVIPTTTAAAGVVVSTHDIGIPTLKAHISTEYGTPFTEIVGLQNACLTTNVKPSVLFAEQPTTSVIGFNAFITSQFATVFIVASW